MELAFAEKINKIKKRFSEYILMILVMISVALLFFHLPNNFTKIIPIIMSLKELIIKKRRSPDWDKTL